MNNKNIKSHIALFSAMVIFGLMAPFAKDAMSNGLTGWQLATLRIAGAALLFWLATPFVKRQSVDQHDFPKIALAGLLGVTASQAALVIGISVTSPVNASIEVTCQPIFAMLLAAAILKEPITRKKAAGVLLGCMGSIMLIVLGVGNGGRDADFRGDLIILGGQFCFALYLTLFQGIIRKYNLFTLNRWMFTFATLFILPFSWHDITRLTAETFSIRTTLEVGYIIVFATFITFSLVVYSQRTLRPTVVSTYNYIQPVVTTTASVLMGIAAFYLQQAVASLLIFTGVWFVISSKGKTKSS